MIGFDSITHRYSIDGRRVPSVTEVLRAAGIYSSYEFAEAIHRFRGAAVHACCAALDFGLVPEIDAPPEHQQIARDILEGYCVGFLKWKARTQFKGACWECSLIDSTSGVGGTFDVVGHFAGNVSELVIVDLKSGTLPPMVPVQLAAYEELIRRGEPVNPDHPGWQYVQDAARSGVAIRRVAVRLEKDGKETQSTSTKKGEAYDLGKWAAVWRSALNCYCVREAYGLLEKTA